MHEKYLKDFPSSEQFANIPSYLQPTAVSDVETFLDYLTNYEDVTLKEVEPHNIENVLTQIFPRKVSAEPEEFRHFIPILVSFFEFLKAKRVLKEADSLIKAIRDSEEEMVKNAANPAYYGMAKDLVMQMRKDGVDLDNQDEIGNWIADYNQRINSEVETSVDPDNLPITKQPKIGRNTPCPCGSGKKYKKCCGG